MIQHHKLEVELTWWITVEYYYSLFAQMTLNIVCALKLHIIILSHRIIQHISQFNNYSLEIIMWCQNS